MAKSLFRAVLRSARSIRQSGLDWYFDRRRGTRTSGEVALETLGLAAAGRVQYIPSGWLVLPRILKTGDVGPHDVFLDYGSGKGRAVLQAARRYPFKRVIGVELSDELNQIARANLERERARLRCQDVELITADAVDYIPPPDVTVAFFYNPFTGALFDRVIARLLDSIDHNPRPVRIILVYPECHDRLMATGRVELIRRRRGWRPGRDWSQASTIHLYRAR